MPKVKCKAKICNNEWCLKESGYIKGYLKCKNKDIPICKFREFCPDAHFRYFDYKPKYIKKEMIICQK